MELVEMLPEPQVNLDFPLMKAIGLRRTRRTWSGADLSLQVISDLLWVACGVTRPRTSKSKSRRTAPSACNSQEVRVYLAVKKGLFLYEEEHHCLIPVHSTDIRQHVSTQKMMHSAPLALIYVADFSRMKGIFFKDDGQRWFTSAADTGFISQNVYLYCAASELSTAVISLVDREMLHSVMMLKESERVVFTQVVG